jgi:class 3 adenylate cyclase
MEQVRARVARTIEKGVQIDLSTTTCKRFLRRHASRKTTVAVLYVDIDGSTQMTLSLPSDTLATMLQLFSQEMSLAVASYGGYVLKYVGDAVIALFPAEHDRRQACTSALECGRTMVEIVSRCINPVLCAKGMPELKVKVSIDLGEVLVVLYGKGLENSHIDIIGPSISMAAKMLSLVQSGRIIMGQTARDSLAQSISGGLVQIDADESVWSYVDASKSRYRLYTTQEPIKEL